jgi:hypothetical protein
MPYDFECANDDCTGIVKFANAVNSESFRSTLLIDLPKVIIPCSRCRRVYNTAGYPISNNGSPVYLVDGKFIKQ